jgi:glycerol-3-phosphate acyltransferase PlsY
LAKTVLSLIACYLIGSIPFGLLAGWLFKKVDIRDFGSGNIGATNVLRTLGPGPAFLVFLLDTAKGFIAVLICKTLIPGNDGLVVAGALMSVAGHNFSIFLKFRGGKGVATTLGVILGLNLTAGLIGLGVWILFVGITRYISIASIVAAITVPTVMHFWTALDVPNPFQWTAVVAALAIIIKHRPNIKRLLNGTESRVGQRVKMPSDSEEPK